MSEFPFVLLTGRGTSAQWHTNTRTGKSAVLRTLYPANAYVEMQPHRRGTVGIAANTPRSPWCPAARALLARRSLRRRCSPGQVFIPMHYGVTNNSPALNSIRIRASRVTSTVRCGWRKFHETSNAEIEHRTPNDGIAVQSESIRRSAFNVRCSKLSIFP